MNCFFRDFPVFFLSFFLIHSPARIMIYCQIFWMHAVKREKKNWYFQIAMRFKTFNQFDDLYHSLETTCTLHTKLLFVLIFSNIFFFCWNNPSDYRAINKLLWTEIRFLCWRPINYMSAGFFEFFSSSFLYIFFFFIYFYFHISCCFGDMMRKIYCIYQWICKTYDEIDLFFFCLFPFLRLKFNTKPFFFEIIQFRLKHTLQKKFPQNIFIPWFMIGLILVTRIWYVI